MVAKGRKPALDDEGCLKLMELHRKGLSQREIATALNVSARTVQRYGGELGLTWSKQSDEDYQADTKTRYDRIRAKRAALAERLLDDAERMRQELYDEYVDSAFVGGAMPTHLKATLDQPKAQDQAHLVRSITTILQRIEPVLADPADAADTAKSVLGELAKALSAKHAEQVSRDDVPGVKDDLQDSAEDVYVQPDAQLVEVPEMPALPKATAKKKTRYCDLGTDCPNKSRPHLRGAGPCIAEPLSVEDATRE